MQRSQSGSGSTRPRRCRRQAPLSPLAADPHGWTPSARFMRAPRAARAQSSTPSRRLVLTIDQPLRRIGAVAEHVRRGEASRSSTTASGSRETPSIAVFTRRNAGIVTGSITSCCTSNSSATSCAARLVGSATGVRAGVRALLPSSLTTKPPSPSSHGRRLVETLRQRCPHLQLGAADRVRIGQLRGRIKIVQNVAHVLLSCLQSTVDPRRGLFSPPPAECTSPIGTVGVMPCRTIDDDQAGRNQSERQEYTWR